MREVVPVLVAGRRRRSDDVDGLVLHYLDHGRKFWVDACVVFGQLELASKEPCRLSSPVPAAA